MPNQLAGETSPYLLQHAENPVDWRPWGEPALRQARDQDKPIFLSIGYSACHWCHVMEHESFEDQVTAEVLNEHFIPIKVDREERPDLDQVYMNAVQLMTRQGGWPLNVFLTPQLQPFYGGTYWPPSPMHGRPSFQQVLQAVRDAWHNRREMAVEQAAVLTADLQRIGAGGQQGQLEPDFLPLATVRLERSFDSVHGGFGKAPKFPHPMDIQLLLARSAPQQQPQLLDMACLTLDKMARGGIYDHLGGGFARYSVDAQWLVPHFEKMLYDNALLAGAYLDGYLVTRRDSYRQVVTETLDYVLRDMTDRRGGFHSAEDADSEGEEGKFYVWSLDELRETLGRDAAERFAYVYGATEQGNFEGRNILHLPRPVEEAAGLRQWELGPLRRELTESRARLLKVRNERVRPAKDDKVLVNWNALMIDSMARAGAALEEPRYLQAAVAAAEFIRAEMRTSDGRLRHCWRLGRALEAGFLDDYAGLANALVSLHQATWQETWIDWAVELAEQLLKRFHDAEGGGFFFTADDHETLIARNKDLHDASVPSGNALAATALLRLGRLCGRRDFVSAAEATLQMAAETIERSPMTGQLLIALDLYFGPMHEVVVVSPPGDEESADLSSALRRQFAPRRVAALRDGSGPTSQHLDPAFAGKSVRDGRVTTYICQDHACQAPVVGAQASVAELAD